MKTKIILFLSVLVLLVACKTSYPREQQSGKEDVAFLLFVSYKQYVNKPLTVVFRWWCNLLLQRQWKTERQLIKENLMPLSLEHVTLLCAVATMLSTQKSCSYLHKRPNKLNYHNEKTFIYCPTCWLNDGLFDPKNRSIRGITTKMLPTSSIKSRAKLLNNTCWKNIKKWLKSKRIAQNCASRTQCWVWFLLCKLGKKAEGIKYLKAEIALLSRVSNIR